MLAFVTMAAFAAAAGGQVVKQVLLKDDILERATGMKGSAFGGPELRGTIFSADGKVLAQAEDAFELSLHYSKLPMGRGFFLELSKATGISEAELRLAFSEPKGGKPITKTWRSYLTPEQKAAAEKVYDDWGLRGMSLVPRSNRIKPMGEAFDDVIGVSGQAQDTKTRKTASTGLQSLELTLDGFLTGEGKLPGLDKAKVNGLTEKIRERLESQLGLGADKRNVVLTLDSGLQQVAFDAARRAVIRSGAVGATVMVLNPKTGDLVACADYPVGRPDPDKDKPLNEGVLFAPTDATYEPGSMWKLLTLAKAYDDGVVSPNDHFLSESSLAMPSGKPIRNHGGRSFGPVTPREAMAHSCNVTAAKWALMVGSRSYYQWLHSTGAIEQKAGLGMEGESTGQFHYGLTWEQRQARRRNNEGWGYAPNRRDLASVGFGQGINVTPVSLIGLFGMIANGGEYIAPRLIKSMGGLELKAENRGRFLSKRSAELALDAAEAVCNLSYGTGYSLRVPGVHVGGKTGTAQIVRGRGEIKGYRANFVGFVPAERPKYVVLVMVDRPRGADYYGGSVAGPAFSDTVRAMLSRGMLSRSVEPATLEPPKTVLKPEPSLAASAPLDHYASDRDEDLQGSPGRG